MLLWAAQSIRSWLEHGSREPSCGSLISEWRLHRDLCIYTGGVAQGKPGILPGLWPILTAPLLISWGEARHRAHHHLALALVPSSLSFQPCPPHHKHCRQISSSGNEASLKRWVRAPEAVTASGGASAARGPCRAPVPFLWNPYTQIQFQTLSCF